MKLSDMDFDNITHVVMKSPISRKPDEEWTASKQKSIIPDNLYLFYAYADYFSILKAPKYLDDKGRYLFSYLGLLLNSMLYSFNEAFELVSAIKEYQEKQYTPLKKIKGKAWNQDAHKRLVRSFRYLVINVAGILDQLSEVVSLLFHGDIKGLTVGRSSFSVLREYARNPYRTKAILLSPKEHYFIRLNDVLTEELETKGEETGWSDLLWLYRNKLAHLGSKMFPILTLHNREGEFYSFLPNRWPIFYQTYIKFGNHESEDKDNDDMKKYAETNYINQDIVEYSENILLKVKLFINRSFEVLCEAYKQFKELDLNKSALSSLKKKQIEYKFKSFKVFSP